MKTGIRIRTISLLVVAGISANVGAVSMDGDTVTAEASSVVDVVNPTSAIVGAGAEFDVSGASTPFFSIDLFGTSVVFTSLKHAIHFTSRAITIGDIDFPDAPGSFITGFNFSTDGGVSAIVDASRVTFTANSVTFEFTAAGTASEWPTGSTARIDLLTSTSSVPDGGATVALFGLAAASLAVARRQITGVNLQKGLEILR